MIQYHMSYSEVLCTLHQFPPMEVLQYTIMTRKSTLVLFIIYSDFTGFTCIHLCVCICIVLCNFKTFFTETGSKVNVA